MKQDDDSQKERDEAKAWFEIPEDWKPLERVKIYPVPPEPSLHRRRRRG